MFIDNDELVYFYSKFFRNCKHNFSHISIKIIFYKIFPAKICKERNSIYSFGDDFFNLPEYFLKNLGEFKCKTDEIDNRIDFADFEISGQICYQKFVKKLFFIQNYN